MANDIGMIKSIFPPTAEAQAAPAAGRPATVAQDAQGAQPAQAGRRAADEPEPLERVVSDLNQLVRDLHRELRFSVDKDSGDTVIKVIDRETEEVVRQIPSEELMHLRKRLQETAGVIFHDSA